MSKKIYLVDGNNFIYRMFFALPEFATKDWKIVNAIFGMAKFFVGQLVKENPDYLIFVKDAKWKNFRHDLYDDYKATRDRMPDNLRDQISDIEKMIKMMGVDIIEIDWYEADDVIWTLADSLWKDKTNDIYILTWDKDLYSLVSENVKIYDTMKKKIFWINETKEKFEIEPKMIIDYLAIVGDKADNIPWIEGFWPKKAVSLINGIWGVEEIYEILEKWDFESLDDDVKKVFKGKNIEKLELSKENAFLSKKLATIALDVSLEDFSLENFAFDPVELQNEKVIEYFKSLEFHSLVPKDQLDETKKWADLWLKVQIVWDKQGLDDLKKSIKSYENIILDTETTSLNVIEAELVWISIYLDDSHIYYINRWHNWPQVTDDDLHSFLDFLFWSDKFIVWHNLKYDLEILELYRKNTKILHKTEPEGLQMTIGI